MYLLYIDESGDLNSWETQQNFVLGAIAIHEGQIPTLTTRMMEVQREFFPTVKIPLSFHAYEIRRGNGVYATISSAEREHLMDRIYGIIAETEFPKIVVFATAINISAVTSEEQVLHDVFEDLCSRFNYFSKRVLAKHSQKNIIVLIKLIQNISTTEFNLKTWGTRYQKFRHTPPIMTFHILPGRQTMPCFNSRFCAICFDLIMKYDRNYLNKIIRCFDKRPITDSLTVLSIYTRW